MIKIILFGEESRPINISYIEHLEGHRTNFFYQRIVSPQRQLVYQHANGAIEYKIRL